MPLSWNEVKERAIQFSNEWKDAFNEEADAKQFLIEFFHVFGISNRRVATFEHRVKKVDDSDGYIDLLWKGTVLIEMKSRGKNLDKAYQQAIDYTHGLKETELPKYILVSDFATIRLYDLEILAPHSIKGELSPPLEGCPKDGVVEFKLSEFVNHVHLFGFIAGYQKRTYKEEDPVNIEAAYHMGILHDALKEAGYTGRDLEIYLVRLLFCLFADDTGIFERGIFTDYLSQRTHPDGSDLGMHLAQLFQVLNTPDDKRLKTLDENLAQFPYINGHLFEQQLPFASFNSKMRGTLIECCLLDWNKISPAIFGSMFQSVMNETERRNLGAHYTSEKNILKLIKPLFLDGLWQEFHAAKTNSNKLRAFHKKVASMRFLDPACGCGNFLVITYRELRLLELAILKELQRGQMVHDISQLVLCDVDRFYGIEYEDFAAQIAQVALWLTDHQMNMLVSAEFGEYFVRLPLRKSAKITHGNALHTEWVNLVEPLPWETPARFDYILGNPPFVGKQLQKPEQKADMEQIFIGVNGAGVLDYVTAWYIKAAKYLQEKNTDEISNDRKTRVAFVSTNSIAQGEQVGILWNELFNRYKIKIHFAHHTFKWNNEARANAAVHVVIIGFSNFDITEKLIYEYEDIKGEPHELKVKNINPYLVEGKDFVIISRTKPIITVPEMIYGSKPVDDGNLLLNEFEKDEYLKIEPEGIRYIKPILSSHEFLNGKNRFCFWLHEENTTEINSLPILSNKLKKVREFREKSTKQSVREQAKTPYLFSEIRQPKEKYVLIPRHSTENRRYIPFGFFDKDVIVSDSCTALPKATLFHFGIISSSIHMTWVKYVCGRIKSDYRYSNVLVYNNFPWPENPTEKQKEAIEKAAQKVLDVRSHFQSSPHGEEWCPPTGGRGGSGEGELSEGRRGLPAPEPNQKYSSPSGRPGGASLADLYNPLTMPPELVKAHNELDKAVDLAYRPQPFASETKRIEFLFELYDKYVNPLIPANEKRLKKNR